MTNTLTPLMAKAVNTIVASGGSYTAHGVVKQTFAALERRGLVRAVTEQGSWRSKRFIATDAALEVAVQLEGQGVTQGLHENI